MTHRTHYAKTDRFLVPDGRAVKIGDRLSLNFRLGVVKGLVTSILIPIRGAGTTLLTIEPDYPAMAERYDTSYPLSEGGVFIYCRDVGYPIHHYEGFEQCHVTPTS